MSQTLRQSELFAGENWTVLYRAFNQINFNSYDPPSINAALREYIQSNYPEDFNDWIESSELVAIIDLLSWLAGSLAFRTDVNARENFLETAQARESVLRLARFLSYNPRRAQSGRGLVKITEVKTTESLTDSFGANLNNRAIKWNDPDNQNWMEQFTLVLNATFPATNPYGIPFKTSTSGTTKTQLYRMSTAVNPNCVYSMDAVVNGKNEKFELVNVDIDDNSGFKERTPNPNNGFHMVYRNDGRGNASARTGFFMLFKQGSLNQQLFSITNPVENRLIDITQNNISETDVWVQTLDDSNGVIKEWTKVPAVFGDNITFNDITSSVRDIFSVITRDNDEVTLRFSDGRFGAVPVGNLKVWFRSVNGLQYQIRPRDMENIAVVIPYLDFAGRNQELTIRVSLQETVSNAIGAESIEQIRKRAPQVYGTQNRMVSGEDYNIFPLSSNEIIKMRSVNRVYSGHSRHIDITDPTATLQDTVVFSDDGIIYKESQVKQYTQVPLGNNFTTNQIVARKIQPMLEHPNVKNFFLDYCIANADKLNSLFTGGHFVWKSVNDNGFNSTGYLDGSMGEAVCRIDKEGTPQEQEIMVGTPFQNASRENIEALRNFISPNAKLKFTWVEGMGANAKTIIKWATVASTTVNSILEKCEFGQQITNKDERPITLDESIPDGAVITLIVPPYRHKLDNRSMDRIDLGDLSEINKIAQYITDNIPFELFYCIDENSQLSDSYYHLSGKWIVAPKDEIKTPPVNTIKVLTGTYNSQMFWSFETVEGTRYVFESEKNVRWANLKDHKVVDAVSGKSHRDTISVLWPTGDKPSVIFDIVDNIYTPDGLPDYRKVVVVPQDSDDDGFVDIPDSFSHVVTEGSPNPDYVIFERNEFDQFRLESPVIDFPIYNAPTTREGTNKVLAPAPDGDVGEFVFVSGNELYDAAFYTRDYDEGEDGEYVELAHHNFVPKIGRGSLRFQWQHFANSQVRIDPAITNIIDVFVLTAEYDFLTRQWIKDGTPEDGTPTPPTALDLQTLLTEFQQYKMFSDQVVWRPVKYKYLFGDKALPELQAQFKIIRLPSSPLSDGEIRSRVVSTVNEYFDVNKWEFGETFYFTELAAYIHMQLATAISSVVIVPLADKGKFGELFEVRCNTDELFISTAQVTDVVIIDVNTMSNLRIQ